MNCLLLSLFLCTALLAQVGRSALYGYYSEASASQLVVIDVQSGDSKRVCDLSHLPPLSGASSSSKYSEDGVESVLLFYTIDAAGNISLVSIDPSTCKSNITKVTGLNSGQNLVRDIKYDSVNEMLYMVFPNPFCMHGSLDKVNVNTAAVISHLADVVDPEGLSQTAGLSRKTGTYYFVGIPLGATTVNYQLTKVALSTGNISTVNLANNNIDVGDMWSTNYTLNVVIGNEGETIFGAISPSSTTVAECSPSGFYSINPSTGNVSCVFGPIEYQVYPLAELDNTAQYFYQLFNDQNGKYYLYTFDTVGKKVIHSTPCEVCNKLSVLASLP